MEGFAEGLTLAGEVGISQETMLEVIALSAIASPMFKLKVGGDACVDVP